MTPEPGKRYRFRVSDCCVEGDFMGLVEDVEVDEEGYVESVTVSGMSGTFTTLQAVEIKEEQE